MSTPTTLEQWVVRATELAFDGRPFIDGQRVQPISAETFAVSHARSGGVLTNLPDCGQADVDRRAVPGQRCFVLHAGRRDRG
jgi:4-(gamma-glutamylamino)butanal dehydrogenase